MKQRLNTALKSRRERLQKLSESYVFTQKDRLFRGQYQNLDLLQQRLDKAFFEDFEKAKSSYQLLKEKLAVLSPLNTLERGYSICLKDQKPLRSAAEVQPNEDVCVQLHQGVLHCTVKETGEGAFYERK